MTINKTHNQSESKKDKSNDLSKAAEVLRSKSSTAEERSRAASIMGHKGGKLSHSSHENKHPIDHENENE